MRRALAFVVVAGVAFASTLGLAEQPKGGHHHKPRPPKSADAGAPATPTPAREEAPPVKATEGDAGNVEAKTLDGGTRVFRFGEVEIEGRMRSPQLVYFLRRVRAEFAAGDLGHRSFMGELSETRRDPSF